MAKKIEILENTLLKLLVRRGTDTDRRNISLSEGELGYTTDTERLFIGNGQPGGVVAGNRYLGSDSDPSATFTTALTGDLVFDTNTKSLCAFKGSGTWERVSSLTESTGDIDVSVDAGDILSNACGRNLSIDTNGRIQTNTAVVFNKINTAGWAYLNIPRKVRFYDGSSSEAFTFPTNALGGKYLRTDASGVLTWEDPVGAAEFFYNSENGPIPVGAVLPFTAGGVIPTGYIVCNGQEVSQTTYSDLFDVIGTNYGTTNPGASFKVPDYSLSTLYGVNSDPHNAQVYKVGADVNLGGGANFGTVWTAGPGSIGRFDGPSGGFQAQATTYTNDTGYYLVINAQGQKDGQDAITVRVVLGDVNYGTTIYQNSNLTLIGATNSGGGVLGTGTVIIPPGEKYTYFFQTGERTGLTSFYTWELRGPASGGGSSGSNTTYTGSEYVAIDVGDIDGTTADPVLKNNTSDDWFVTTGSNLSYNRAMYIRNSDTDPWLNIHPADDGDRGPFVAILQPGASIGHSGGYTAKYWVLKGTATTTPSTQSPLSAQGTIYVIKAIPDTVANPTLTVVSPLTATVDGVNKTNTAFSPLVGDIVIGQPDAAVAVPPGVEAFDTAGTDTFTTVTRYTKFYVTGSGSGAVRHTGASAGTCIGYLDLPVGTVLNLTVGEGVGSDVTTGNYTQIVHNGTVLVRSDGADHPNTTSNTFNWNASPNTGTLNTAYTVAGNQVVSQGSFIIPGASQGVDGNGDNEESVGSASFWGAYPAAGSGMHANGAGNSRPPKTADGIVMFEWVDTVSGGGTTQVTGGGSSLLKYGTIDVGNPGPIAGGSVPTTGDFTTIDLGTDGASFYDIFECTFNSSLPNNNYNVVFELISNGSVNADNNMRYPIITEKTAAGFTFSIEEGTTAVQDLEINVRIESNQANAVIADQKWEAVTDGTYDFDQASNLETSVYTNSTGSPLVIRGQFAKIAVGSADDINLAAHITHAGETTHVSVPFATEIGFQEPTGYSTVVGDITIPAGATYKFVRTTTNYTNLYWFKMTTTAVVGGVGGLKDPNHSGGTINVTTSFQDLDLSSIVGSNKAQVTMEVYGGSTGVGTLFRTKGSVIERFAIGTSAGWGSSGVTPGPTDQGGVVTLTTDSNGVVQFNGAGTSTGVNYKVLTYQVIS